MNIETGLVHALNGRAILFTGSGFSRDAINSAGKRMKTGQELSDMFLRLLNIHEPMSLKTSSSIFLEQKGINELFRIFKREFKVKTITEDQKTVSNVPWSRIYSTNYDDTIERACLENNRIVQPITLTDSIEQNGSFPLCIHINGFVDKVCKQTFNDDVRLTEESYDADTIKTTEWIALLRQDIKLANAVFFVGYGLGDADIELRWLLNESEANKDKTFFITGRNPTIVEKRRIASFGKLCPIEITGFAKKIEEIKKSYIATTSCVRFGSSFDEYHTPQTTKETTGNDAFNLLFYGIVDSRLIKNKDYILPRKIVSGMMEAIHTDTDVLVIHSDIAGGKKICLQEFAEKADLEGLKVFFLKNVNCDTRREFDAIQEIAQSQKVIVVIEKFTYFYDDIVQLLKTKERNVIIVFSSRTPEYEIFISRINADFPKSNIVSLNISFLQNDEILWLIKTFKSFGFLGSLASKETSEISALFSGKKCRSKMGSILLTVFEQPEVATRIRSEYDFIRQNEHARKVLISSYILLLLGCPRIYDALVRIWGISVFNENSIRQSKLSNFIDFDSGEIMAISSSFSRFVLSIEDKSFVFSLLVDLFERINNIKDLRRIRKDLMTYGKLSKLFFNNEKTDLLPRYYDALKEMCREEVLFWLQYAICTTMHEQYAQADVYFSTAYALAKKKENFNPFQIDNSYEKYLLLKSITLPFEEAFELFVTAHEKIIFDLRNLDDETLKFYPYRNMLLYKEFYQKFKQSIVKFQKERFLTYLADAQTYVARKRYYKVYVSDIDNCFNMLLSILGDIRSGVPKDADRG